MSTEPTGKPDSSSRYLESNALSLRVVNPAIMWLVRRGLNLRGARELHVRGRTSGRIQRVPVNPLTIDGSTYLVAPRGNTQWVRNLRVAGTCQLGIGRRITSHQATELLDGPTKLPILRKYLKEWAFEVGQFFDGITVKSSDAELLAVADGFPVFTLSPAPTPAAGTGRV